MPRKRVHVNDYDRTKRGRPEHVRDHNRMQRVNAADDPKMLALRRARPIPVEPHGAFEVSLVDDAHEPDSVRNNIYEIREVGTRKKLAMTGEEILNLSHTLYREGDTGVPVSEFGHNPDDPLEGIAEMPPPGHPENPAEHLHNPETHDDRSAMMQRAYDEALLDAQRLDLGQLEGDQLYYFMGTHLPRGTPTSEITRWLDEHQPKPTIQTAEGELSFVTEVDDIDEAQALLGYQRRHGRAAAATHYNGKHQVYAEKRGG